MCVNLEAFMHWFVCYRRMFFLDPCEFAEELSVVRVT